MREGDVQADFFGDHFADARVGVRFETLGGADENGIWFDERTHRAINLARVSRRHHAQHDVGPGERLFEAARDFDVSRQFKSGKINLVDPPRAEHLDDVGAVRPQSRAGARREDRVNAMASAVPQAPPPMMAIFFMIFCGSYRSAARCRREVARYCHDVLR